MKVSKYGGMLNWKNNSLFFCPYSYYLSMLGASHIHLLCLISWSVTRFFIIGGDHQELRGSVPDGIIILQ